MNSSSSRHHPKDLLPSFRQEALSGELLRSGEKLLVAFSGGTDSVVLLDLLLRLKDELQLEMAAAHMDHQLRPESPVDRAFCRDFCSERGIAFHEREEDIRELARLSGLGLEGAGRLARYRWLETLRSEGRFDRIALGHQLDDHGETLLLWLFRGTGLQGLQGIAPLREHITRPLRSFSREQIEAYLRWRDLPFREDASNSSPSFLRNRIRQELIPLLRDIFGTGALDRLDAFAARGLKDHEALQALADELLEECRLDPDPEGLWLDREAFLSAPRPLQYRLLRRIADDFAAEGDPQRWNQPAYERVLNFTAQANAGKRCPLPGGGWLEVQRDRLFWRTPTRHAPEGSLDLPRESWVLKEELLPPDESGIRFYLDRQACFDADSIVPPLRLRYFQAGDRMNPMGMKGRKRLVDLYREHGISTSRRSRSLVVEDAQEIIWVVGITTAGKCRIHPGTRSMLRLRLENGETE